MTLSVDASGRQTGDGFYSKRLPKGRADWLQTCRVAHAERLARSTSCA
jgi:hypothetical protein